MDLFAFDDVSDRVFVVKNKQGEPLKTSGGKAVEITFFGRDTSQHMLARNKMLNELRKLAGRATPGDPTKVQDEQAIYIQFTAEITKGWSVMPAGGKEIEFSVANAATVYRKGQWIKRQVDAFLVASNKEADGDFTQAAA